MIKKILLAIFATLPFMAVAQQAGTWVLHPYYVGTYLQGLGTMNCIDAGNKIYYLTQGSLFAYDKASETNQVLDLNSSLNDINISQIYYNYNKQYLVVAYNDCNIDIVKAGGDVVNIPAIKEVVMTSQKTINDVTFGNGKIYIATSFGYITLDENTLGVDEVRDFQTSIASVAIVGEKKIMSVGNKFYFCNAGEDKETLNDFSSLANSKGAAGRIYTINDSTFFLSIATNASNLTAGTLQVVSVKDDGGTTSFTLKQIAGNMPFSVQPTPAGYVASFGSSNYYYTFDNKGENATRATGNELYTSQEEGNWWVCGASGLAHIVNGVKGEYFLPSGISITKNAYWTVYDPSQQRILLSSTADNQFVSNYSGVKTEVNSYDGSTWRNITPSGVPNNSGNYRLVVSPNEPDTYFYSCRSTGGIVKVQGNNMVANYKASNSPYYEMASPLCFDSKGNLWMVITRNTSNIDAFAITPQNQLSTQVDSSLFVINNMDGACHASNNGHKRTAFDVGAGDIKVFTAGEWGHPLVFWESNDDLSLKRYKQYTSFQFQDGSVLATSDWNYVRYIKADNDGMIWVGYYRGIFSLDPRNAFNDDFKFNKIKVRINEGNETDETLLEGIEVSSIDVDKMNNKWIGSSTQGVFFVSPDGSEIYKHFDTTNSPLPSDQIYSVCCNRATNSVLIVTPNGIVEYLPDVIPGASDYNDVVATPSMIYPNFTGLISIEGLMSNSNVIITNSEGNTVATLQSRGSIATWDACDETGNRVKTGIYKVFASQGETSTTGEPLTTIAVIK